MRTPVSSGRFAVASVVAVVVVAWTLPALSARVAKPSPAQFGGGGFVPAAFVPAGAAEDEGPPVPRVYYKAPFSPDAAAVWIKLQKKAPLKFENEIPLEEFLKKFKEAADGKDDAAGVMIYVDPIGLQEAEKTMASSVTINLANVRLETGLRLVLKQLSLTFHVDPDGLLMITSNDSKNSEHDDAESIILDKLDALQKQVAELRSFQLRGAPVGGGRPATAK